MPLMIFVRHGENDYVKTGKLAGRLPGVHLNDRGKAQAQTVAQLLCQKLKGAPVKHIYSSPLERTQETAQPIAQAFGVDVVTLEGLIEVDIGDWQDQELKKLRRLKLWRQVQGNPSLFNFPGGEAFVTAQHRICQAVNTLAAQVDPKDILILVSHSDPIKLAVAYYLGMPLDCFQRLAVAPASITTLYISETGTALLNLNIDPAFFQPPVPKKERRPRKTIAK